MSWQYSDNEFVKLFRKMTKWEWYTDVNTKTLFIHCLLKANWRDTSWRGIKLKRGQFVTSLASLSRETGLSVRQVRTALKHLKMTGEVTSTEHSKFRVITVNSYGDYQASDKQTDKQATKKRQASDKQATTDIRSIRSIRTIEDKEEAPPEKDTRTPEELRQEGWDI